MCVPVVMVSEEWEEEEGEEEIQRERDCRGDDQGLFVVISISFFFSRVRLGGGGEYLCKAGGTHSVWPGSGSVLPCLLCLLWLTH